jgi:hypothetical protein
MSQQSTPLSTWEKNPAPGRRWAPRLRTKAASEYLAEMHGVVLAPATLNKLRVVGGGPAFEYDGRNPVYQPPILDSFAQQRLGRLRASTSDTEAAPAA